MLAADNADALSSAASIDSSNSMLEHEQEDDDGWVVVKKQRITILVPPSPVHPQSTIPETNNIQAKSRRIVRRNSGLKKRSRKLSKGEHKQPAATPIPRENETQGGEIGINSRGQEPNCSLVAMPEKLQRPPFAHSYGHERSNPIHSNTRTLRLRVDALSVVNLRLRALNLERKLKGLGGVRRWLASHGLNRFITVFEREKLGKYQLVNLTMNKLKDMGTNAVGPRRKLIHAIDCLCQPYYFKPLQ